MPTGIVISDENVMLLLSRRFEVNVRLIKTMRILVIEDEKKAAAYLKKGLSESGFIVDVAENGETGLHLALATDYDLVILDVMLPGRDGWSIMTELRRAGKQTLSLFLTAKDSLEDRVKGLDLGADAYLVKPFAFSELMAQIRTLFRRSPMRQPEIIKIGDLEVDFIQHRATRAGQRLDLTPKEFALLSLLCRRAGEVLSRTLIAEQVWDMNFDSDTNVVDVQVRRLRAKVDDPYPKKLIHTQRGMGYVLREE
jgi:two-component system copper resistance phosphate regulon response regulator CusR